MSGRVLDLGADDAAARPPGAAPMRVRVAWWAAAALLGIPAAVTAWVLLGDFGAFFWDARTLPCGIEAMIATGHPNAYLDPGYPGNCAGYRFEYMAPPAVTKLLAGLASAVGIDTLVVCYGLAYALALASLGRTLHRIHGSLTAPVAFAAAFGCGLFVFEVASGNLSIVFGALLSASILAIDRRAWVPAVLCVLAALFKPHYALYLLVPLLARRDILTVSFAAAVVSLWYAADAALDPRAFADWLALILPVVHGEPHFGFMRLMQLAGYGQGDWILLAAAYALWCALVIALSLRACASLASPVDRAFAGLAAATLLLPRLKEYDGLVLVPLFFWTWRLSIGADRLRLRRFVLAAGFVAPALWWWARKVALLAGDAPLTLRAAAELKWHLNSQGVFLAAALVIVFTMMVRVAGRGAPGERSDAPDRLPGPA